MKTSSLGIALLASVAIGCNDASGPGTATPSDLVGAWNASAYTLTSLDNSSLSAELIGMGMVLTITFTETNYSGVATFADELPEDFSGTYTIDGNSLILNEVGQEEPELMGYTLLGNVLTLTGADDEHDFDDDGQEESASFVIVLDRQ